MRHEGRESIKGRRAGGRAVVIGSPARSWAVSLGLLFATLPGVLAAIIAEASKVGCFFIFLVRLYWAS